MRTFEFKEGKSAKFWNIELKGNAFTVIYGRLGTTGQTQSKTFADAAKAQTAHDKLIAEKTGKGYVETTAKQAAVSPLQHSLEKALVENPDDLTNHSAYADYLTEQGDPRGEFIQVQLALEDPKRLARERKELESREKELLKKHGAEWLGELAGPLLKKDRTGLSSHEADAQKIQYGFARGWLDSLEVSYLSVQLARILARSAETRLLRRLVIEQTASQNPIEDTSEIEQLDEFEGWYEPGADAPAEEEGSPGLHPLRRSPYLANLRVLQLGEKYEDSQYGGPSCHTRGEGVVDLVKKLPRLEELYLMAHDVDTAALFGLKTLTNLRILEVDHINVYPLKTLAKNPAMSRLTHLLLHPHGLDDEEAYIRLDGLKEILKSPQLKSLTHLRLRLADFGDDGCKAIVDSGILQRLKMLDFSHGRISDEGAKLLAACPDLRKLDLLNVSYNGLTKTGIAALKATGVALKADEQFSANEIEENMYLYGGDPE
jgi:uncharacterized protein (TIGR02996 family)